MSGFPDVLVELDDGTGTFPYNISSQVSLTKGLTKTYGRSDPVGAVTPTVVNLTLENTDGAFLLKSAPVVKRTNLVTNPSFEVNTTGWVAGGSVVPTLAQYTSGFLFGAASMRVTWGTGGVLPLAKTVLSGLTVGQVYTVSAYLFVPAGSPSLLFAISTTSTTFSSTFATKDAWGRLSVSFTATAGSHDFQIWPATAPTAGQLFYIDGALAELGSTLGDYFDGTTTGNKYAHAWTGTAHASTSTESLPVIYLDQPIRITRTLGATTARWFTGSVSSWPVEWPGGGQERAVTTIMAQDSLPRLGRQKLKSRIYSEIKKDSPVLWYQLREPQGSTVARDSSGRRRKRALRDKSHSGALPSFGSDSLPVSSCTSMSVTGRYLVGAQASAITTSDLTMECFAKSVPDVPSVLCLTTGNSIVDVNANGSVVLQMTNLGTVVFVVTPTGSLNIIGTTDCTDGAWHHFAVRISGTNCRLYVDGVQEASGTISGGSGPPALNTLLMGGDPFYGPPSAAVNIAQVAVWDSAITAARIAAHATAGLTDFTTDSATDRLTRYCGYAGITGTSFETSRLQSVGALDIEGLSPTEAMQNVVDSENGLLFVNASGALTFQSGKHRAGEYAAGLSLTSDDIDTSLNILADMDTVTNDVTVSLWDDSDVTLTDSASITRHGNYPEEINTLIFEDDDAYDVAAWAIATRAEATPRLPSLSVDLLTQTSAVQQAAMLLELSDLISFSSMPSQASALGAQTIEGWTETMQADGESATWSMEFNTTPFAMFQAWVLEDATYGVLDSTTRAGY